MKRIFSIMAAIAMFMILSLGGILLWSCYQQLNQAKLETAKVTAEGLASNLAAEVNLLQQLVNTLAQSPATVTALSNGEAAQLQQVAAQLEKYIPGVMKVRLLPPNTTEIDNSSQPVMGYADLDMVRESFTTPQLPAIHDQGTNMHLAIVARCVKNNSTIGIVLASINTEAIYSKLQSLNPTTSYLGLMQGNVELMQRGPLLLKTKATNQLSVPHTHWNIFYGSDSSFDWAGMSLDIGLLLLLLILTGVLLYFGLRQTEAVLLSEQAIVLKAIKELGNIKGKTQYAPMLESTQAIIKNLLEYERVTHKSQTKFAGDLKADTLNNLLEENMDFQELLQAPKKAEASPTRESKPLNMPTRPQTPSQASDIFRAYDIRGIVDKTLTKDIVYNIGRAFGSEAKEQGIAQIVIGYDGRISSPAFAEALAKGVITAGVNVIDIGMVPTPLLYFAAQQIESQSGIMITGSHNPAQYNGLKLVLKSVTLAENQIQALKQRIQLEDYMTAHTGTIVRNNRFTNDYIGVISDDIHIVRPMKIVMDCGNGVTGTLGPVLLKTLGCTVIELFCEIDGKFPNHHPDPSKPENLRDLIAAVQHYQADLGVAFDGDGDRLGVVDSKGNIIWPDRQMMLFASEVLKDRPGSPVLFDVKCSNHLGKQITAHGGQPIMWKSGHSLMKAKIKETGAKLAGEMSGHIFFNDRWFGFDDGLYAASRLVEILSADARNSADVFASFPDSFNTPELNVPLPEDEKFRFIEAFRNTATFKNAQITNIDGFRAEFADGWGLVRASNTTPTLVLRFEADTPEALIRIQTDFKTHLLNLNPNLLLPF